MKKWWLLCGLLLTVSIQAQQSKPGPKSNANGRKVRVGAHFSPNIGWIKSDDRRLVADGSRMSYAYGFGTDWRIHKNLSFYGGFDILSLQSRIINRATLPFSIVSPAPRIDTSTSTNYLYKNQYLEFPLLFTGKTNEIGYLTYFIQAGISPAILLTSKARMTASTSNISWEGDAKINAEKDDEYHTAFDNTTIGRVGFVMGLGAEYNLGGTTSVYGSLHFNNGLTRMMKSSSLNYDVISTKYISLNLGIYF